MNHERLFYNMLYCLEHYRRPPNLEDSLRDWRRNIRRASSSPHDLWKIDQLSKAIEIHAQLDHQANGSRYQKLKDMRIEILNKLGTNLDQDKHEKMVAMLNQIEDKIVKMVTYNATNGSWHPLDGDEPDEDCDEVVLCDDEDIPPSAEDIRRVKDFWQQEREKNAPKD